jgi:hypothetical protein
MNGESKRKPHLFGPRHQPQAWVLSCLRVSGDREHHLAVLDASADNSTGLRVSHSTMRKPDAYPEIVDAPDQRSFTFKAPGPDRARHCAHVGSEQWRRARLCAASAPCRVELAAARGPGRRGPGASAVPGACGGGAKRPATGTRLGVCREGAAPSQRNAPAIVAMARGDLAPALEFGQLWKRFTARAGAIKSAMRWELLLACAHAAQGQTARAQRELRSALVRAMSGGFVRSFLDEGEAITQLLQAQLDASQIQTGAIDIFVARLVQSIPPAAAALSLRRRSRCCTARSSL